MRPELFRGLFYSALLVISLIYAAWTQSAELNFEEGFSSVARSLVESAARHPEFIRKNPSDNGLEISSDQPDKNSIGSPFVFTMKWQQPIAASKETFQGRISASAKADELHMVFTVRGPSVRSYYKVIVAAAKDQWCHWHDELDLEQAAWCRSARHLLEEKFDDNDAKNLLTFLSDEHEKFKPDQSKAPWTSHLKITMDEGLKSLIVVLDLNTFERGHTSLQHVGLAKLDEQWADAQLQMLSELSRREIIANEANQQFVNIDIVREMVETALQ